MKVYLYVRYHQDLETEDQDLQVPEVYADKAKALQHFYDTVGEIQESIDEEEPINVMMDKDDYFHLATDWRIETVYVKEVEVK